MPGLVGGPPPHVERCAFASGGVAATTGAVEPALARASSEPAIDAGAGLGPFTAPAAEASAPPMAGAAASGTSAARPFVCASSSWAQQRVGGQVFPASYPRPPDVRSLPATTGAAASGDPGTSCAAAASVKVPVPKEEPLLAGGSRARMLPTPCRNRGNAEAPSPSAVPAPRLHRGPVRCASADELPFRSARGTNQVDQRPLLMTPPGADGCGCRRAPSPPEKDLFCVQCTVEVSQCRRPRQHKFSSWQPMGPAQAELWPSLQCGGAASVRRRRALLPDFEQVQG